MSTSNLKVDFKRQEMGVKDDSYLKVDAPGLNLQFDSTFNGSHESMFWASPLSKDKLAYYWTWKRVGINLHKCDYTYGGQ